MWQLLRESKFASYLALFTSFGTLLCCAIPSTLVLLGFGAGLAGFLAKFPQLIWLSENKELIFGTSFFFLILGFFAQRYASSTVCPIDKKDDCEKTRAWAKSLFYLSSLFNVIGAFYAFLLPKLL